MTARVLPFRRAPDLAGGAPLAPEDSPEYREAIALLSRMGPFRALLVARLVIVLALPGVADSPARPADRRRIRTRLEVAERGVTRAVRILVREVCR